MRRYQRWDQAKALCALCACLAALFLWGCSEPHAEGLVYKPFLIWAPGEPLWAVNQTHVFHTEDACEAWLKKHWASKTEGADEVGRARAAQAERVCVAVRLVHQTQRGNSPGKPKTWN